MKSSSLGRSRSRNGIVASFSAVLGLGLWFYEKLGCWIRVGIVISYHLLVMLATVLKIMLIISGTVADQSPSISAVNQFIVP